MHSPESPQGSWQLTPAAKVANTRSDSADSGNLVQAVNAALRTARAAQREWAQRLLRERLRTLAQVPAELAKHYHDFVELSPRPNATAAEVLASEVMPLADACRFAARVGKRALAPSTHSFRDSAWWMGRISVRVRRQPWGTVLILAPSNYPLLLPGVQIVQALAAGNAVVIKPAVGCTPTIKRFCECLVAAGVPSELLQIIDSSIAAGQAAMAAGVDKVLLTGSANSGRAVLAQLAPLLTPSTMELSGCDAVFVTEQADLNRLARCLIYALQLNGGATCIAPRRVFVTSAQLAPLCELLQQELSQVAPRSYQVSSGVHARIAAAAQQAVAAGAQIIGGQIPAGQIEQPAAERSALVPMAALLLRNVTPNMAIAQEDLFGPVVSIITVPNLVAALEADRSCPYSLGASIFGPTTMAEHWGKQIQAGCVVVNDIIVPTADPRVAFGGRDRSGWGVTRGWEGLVEMSRPQVMCTRHGKWLPHLDPRRSQDAELMRGLLQVFHSASLGSRLAALRLVIGRLVK